MNLLTELCHVALALNVRNLTIHVLMLGYNFSQEAENLGLDTHVFELQLALLSISCIKVVSPPLPPPSIYLYFHPHFQVSLPRLLSSPCSLNFQVSSSPLLDAPKLGFFSTKTKIISSFLTFSLPNTLLPFSLYLTLPYFLSLLHSVSPSSNLLSHPPTFPPSPLFLSLTTHNCAQVSQGHQRYIRFRDIRGE